MTMVYVPVKKVMKKTPEMHNQHWHDKKKLDAVLAWLEYGKMTTTSKKVGVPVDTLYKWKQSDWWQEIVRSIEEGTAQSTSTKYSKLVQKALDKLDDRLDNGDHILDSKTGKVIRVPVKAREMSIIAKDAIQTKERLDRIIHKETVKEETINGRLVKLAEQFAQFAMGKQATREGDIIDAEIIKRTNDEEQEDALHEERQT